MHLLLANTPFAVNPAQIVKGKGWRMITRLEELNTNLCAARINWSGLSSAMRCLPSRPMFFRAVPPVHRLEDYLKHNRASDPPVDIISLQSPTRTVTWLANLAVTSSRPARIRSANGPSTLQPFPNHRSERPIPRRPKHLPIARVLTERREAPVVRAAVGNIVLRQNPPLPEPEPRIWPNESPIDIGRCAPPERFHLCRRVVIAERVASFDEIRQVGNVARRQLVAPHCEFQFLLAR